MPNGPKYTSEASKNEARRHEMFFSGYLEANICLEVTFVDGQQLSLQIGDFSPPLLLLSHLISREDHGANSSGICNNTEHEITENPLEQVCDVEEDINTVNSGNTQYFPSVEHCEINERTPDHFDINDDMDTEVAEMQNDHQQPVRNRQDNTASPSMEDHLDTEGLNDEVHSSPPRMQRRGHAMSEFYEFCLQNKQWIALGIDFSLTREAMKRVLKNISAPYKNWVTVRRNLEKYAELYTEKYMSRRGHMLLSDRPIAPDWRADELSPIKNPCTVCHERRTSLQLSSFEYIPLKPRLRKWFLFDAACKQLFEQHLSERSSQDPTISPHSESLERYSDYFDGSLSKTIMRNRGTAEVAKYDIFMDISFDGFQTFANNTYDYWPVIAMIHNLPSSSRFLTRNAVPLGFVKGPNEPVRFDTFLRPFVNEINSINNSGRGTRFEFADGLQREIMVHVLWCKSDSPAAAKCGGFKRSNAKFHCRFCEIEGHYDPASRHYYFPSRCPATRREDGTRQSMKVYYDPKNLPGRNPEEIFEVYDNLEN